MTTHPTVAGTRAYVAAKHAGQVDKAGRPYIEHVMAVAAMNDNLGPDAVMAGLLHDIVEDTDVTLDDLREMGYSDRIVSAVDSVTRREGEPYFDMVRRAAADPLGCLVKLADNAHNSDPRRLADLDPGQAEWFRSKYAKTREILNASFANVDPIPARAGDDDCPNCGGHLDDAGECQTCNWSPSARMNHGSPA